MKWSQRERRTAGKRCTREKLRTEIVFKIFIRKELNTQVSIREAEGGRVTEKRAGSISRGDNLEKRL